MMVCCPKCQYWFDDFTGVCPKCKNNIFGEDAFNVPPPPPELIADGSSLPRTGGTMQSGTPDTAQDRSGEEVYENREQIEISRYYEKLPKPSLLATQEFVEEKIYWRDPVREAQQSNLD